MKTHSSHTPWSLAFIAAMGVILFSACAEPVPIDPSVTAEPYGFLGGLWHGFIAPFSFVCSLFMDNVAMYATNNNGGWYDFGFVLGSGILFGGGAKASRRR